MEWDNCLVPGPSTIQFLIIYWKWSNLNKGRSGDEVIRQWASVWPSFIRDGDHNCQETVHYTQCILSIRVPCVPATNISYNLNMHLMVGANRAVGTGLAGPKEQVWQTRKAWQLPDQYSVHQPMQKCHMEFHGLLQFLLKKHAGRNLGRQLSSTQAWLCHLKKLPVET